MLQGHGLLARGDYEGSLKEYERVLSLAQERSPADAAAFSMGLIHVHPQNPKKDHRRAIGSFNRVIADYPKSAWVEQAKIWIGVLDEAEQSKQEVEKSRQEIEQSKQVIEQSKQEIEKSKQIIDKSKQEIEKSRQEIEKTKQVIEKLKQVDIEIEQKRRVRGK
jgi:DNA repair exonuclease SbcCD ATPase subunit